MRLRAAGGGGEQRHRHHVLRAAWLCEARHYPRLLQRDDRCAVDGEEARFPRLAPKSRARTWGTVPAARRRRDSRRGAGATQVGCYNRASFLLEGTSGLAMLLALIFLAGVLHGL